MREGGLYQVMGNQSHGDLAGFIGGSQNVSICSSFFLGQFLLSHPLYFLPGGISLAARVVGTGGAVVSNHVGCSFFT